MRHISKNVFGASLFWVGLIGAVNTNAGVAVVVNPKSSLTSVTQEDVSNVFLGKTKMLAGVRVITVDQAEGVPLRDEFYKKVTSKDPAQVKAYWARQVFTGKGEPPETLPDDSEIKGLVANNPDAVGYISDTAVDATVKTVLVIH